MRKVWLLVVMLVCSLLMLGAAAPAQAATSPFPICSHDLGLLQTTRCGPYQIQMNHLYIAGRQVSFDGLVGNFNGNVTIQIAMPIVFGYFRWPNPRRVIAAPIPHVVRIVTLYPAWFVGFGGAVTVPKGLRDLGVVWRIGNQYVEWHLRL